MWYKKALNKIASTLYIDDLREPTGTYDFVARSSTDAINYMETTGCPTFISFDHDLGGDDTAMIVAKWMVEKDLDNDGQFIPPDFHFQVHSANPEGAKNIEGLLNNYLQVRERENLPNA